MARSGRRVDYEWSGNDAFGGQINSDATTAFTIVTMGFAGTLMRCRGRIRASLNGPVDGDKTVVACGLIIVTEEQLASGPSAMPDPATDLDAEWIWYGSLLLMCQEIVDTASGQVVDTLEIDTKAMRKFKSSQSIVLIERNVDVSGVAIVDTLTGLRTLFAS